MNKFAALDHLRGRDSALSVEIEASWDSCPSDEGPVFSQTLLGCLYNVRHFLNANHCSGLLTHERLLFFTAFFAPSVDDWFLQTLSNAGIEIDKPQHRWVIGSTPL